LSDDLESRRDSGAGKEASHATDVKSNAAEARDAVTDTICGMLEHVMLKACPGASMVPAGNDHFDVDFPPGMFSIHVALTFVAQPGPRLRAS